MIQFRSEPAKILDIDEQKRLVKGIFVSFDNINSYNEQFSPKAFNKTIKERGPKSKTNRKIKHLANHEFDSVIGVIKELEVTEQGLQFVTMTGRHQLGLDSLYMYIDEVITEHSIGFETLQSQIKKDSNNRTYELITEAMLWEGSYVTFGSDSETPNLTNRSENELMQRAARLEWVLRNGKYTDETFLEFEKQLDKIKEYIKSRTIISTPTNSIAPQPQIIDFERVLNKLQTI